MAGVDDLFAEFLGPNFAPPKPEQVAIAGEQKRVDLGIGYRAGAEADLGLTDNSSSSLSDILDPVDPVTAAQQNMGRGQYRQDSSRIRTNGEAIVDAPIDVINGVFQGALGIAGAGAGIVDADAGAAVSGFANDVNQFANGLQSDDLNAERRALGARQEVSHSHNEDLYQQDIANGKSELMSMLKREGRNFIDSITNQDSATFGSGTFNGVGSLLLGGVLGKGLKALGIAERAAMPAAIGALEGGGAYQQAVSEVMGMSHDTLIAGSPEYAQLLAQGMTAEAAKAQIANDAGLMAGLIQAPVGVATGALVSKFEAAPFKVPSLGSAAGNILKEGVEEGIQGASGELASNIGIQEFADQNRQLSEGVGAAAGEGALFGLGTAGAVQAPGIPVRATISTGTAIGNQAKKAFKAGKDYLVGKGEDILAREAEASPVSRTALDAAMTQVSQDAASPDIRSQIDEAISTSVGDEERQAVSEHVQRVYDAIQLDAPTEASEQSNELVGNLVSQSTDRFDAIRKVSSIAIDESLDPKDRLDAGLYIVDTLNRYQDLFVRDLPEALLNTDEQDPAFQSLWEFQDVLVNLHQHPVLAKTVKLAAQLAADIKAADINTAEEAVTAAHAITAFPETASLDVAERVLLHSEGLPPEKRTNLELTVARLKIEQELLDEARKLKLNPETVAAEVLTATDDDPKNRTPSAAGHFNRVMQALTQRNTPLAKARLERFMKFAQHMNNKVEAYNENYRGGTASKEHQTSFQQLMPNGVFRKSLTGVWINPRTPGSVAHAKMVEANARAVAALANRLAASLPDLGVKPIAEVRLADELQGEVKDINDRHRTPKPDAAPVEQAAEKPTQSTGEPAPSEVAPAEAAAAAPAVSRISDKQAARLSDQNLNDRLENLIGLQSDGIATDEDRATLAILDAEMTRREDAAVAEAAEDELARRREATEAKAETKAAEAAEKAPAPAPAPAPEPKVEQAPENIQQTQPEKVETEVENVEPEVGESSTPGEAYAGLHQLPGKIKNWFYEAFTLPAKPRSRLAGKTGVAQLVLEALASHDSYAAFIGDKVRGTLAPEVAKAYTQLFTLFNPIEDKLGERLDAYLSDDPVRLKALTEGTDDEAKQITSWLGARVLNLVQDKGNGKFAYHPELAESAILAALSWSITAQQRQRTLDDEGVAKLLDVSVSEVARHPWTLDFFNGGIWAGQAKKDLANKIKQFWGVQDNKNAPMGYTEGLAEAIAAEIVVGMQSAGLVEIENSPRQINGKDYTRLVIKPDAAMAEALKTMRRFPDAIDNLVLVDPEYTNFIGSPSTKVATHQMRNGLVKTTRQQRKVIERAQNIEHRINVRTAKLFGDLGLEALQTLFGGGQFDRTKTNINHAATLDGQNDTIRQAFEGLQALEAEVSNFAETESKSVGDVPIYHEFGVSKVGRLHMLGGVNPQANKLVREVVLPTFATVDLTDPKMDELFMLALGQHFGIKVHKQSRSKTISDTHVILGALRPVTEALSDWHTGQGTMGPETVQMIQEAFKAAGADLSPGSLHGLLDYARSLTEDRTKFETSLYIEADGVTDGPINAMMHMASGAFTAKWIRVMQKGGLFLGPNGKAMMTFNQYSQLDPVDLYETTSIELDTALMNDAEGFTSDITQQRNALFHLLSSTLGKDIDFDLEKQELTVRRGITKNPLTVSIYGSGAGGIAGKITGELLGVIYEKLSSGGLDPLLSHALAVLTTKRVEDNEGELVLLPTRVAPVDLTQKVPVNYTLSAGMVENLEANMLALFVEPMRTAISQTIGETSDATIAMRDAVQVQSVFLVHSFMDGIEAALDRKEQEEAAKGSGWKRHDFLSRNELQAVYSTLKHLSPFVETGTQSFMMMATRKAQLKNGVDFGRGLAKPELRTPGIIEGPGYAGVKGIPTMIIGPGDGQHVQNLYVDPDMPANLAVFDGINFGLDTAELGSQLINKAVRDGWLNNPFAHVSDSFSEFVANIDFTSVDGLMMEELVRTLFPPKVRKSKTVADVQQALEDMASQMRDMSIVIQARHNVLAKVDLSVDHMATTESPFVQEGSLQLSGSTEEELADQLNAELEKELARLITTGEEVTSRPVGEDIAEELASLGELNETTGTRSIGMEELRRALPRLHIPTEQRGLLNDMLKALSGSEWQIVLGSLEDIQAERRASGMFEMPVKPGIRINGFAVPENQRVYLIKPTSEILVHELIHAASLDLMIANYKTPSQLSPEQRDAIKRIEQLANQWLKDDFSDLPTDKARFAYKNARRAVQDHLDAGRKALALNEFMAWNLANQELITKGKRTPVLRQLAQLSQAIIAQLKRLIWGKAKTDHVGNDLFSNLRFNTQVLIYSAPTVQAQLAQVVAHHSTEFGHNERLTHLLRGFSRKIGGWLDSQQGVNVPAASAKFRQAITKAEDVAREFQTAFPMTHQEATTFRMIVTALATETKLNPNTLARIQQLYRHSIDQVKVEDFMVDPDANDPNDRYQAQNKLNTLLGHHLSGRDLANRSFLLPSFLALAMTNDQFRKVLGKMEMPKAAHRTDKSFDALLENFGSERMDNLSRMFSGEGRRKDDVEAALDALSEKLIEEISSQQKIVEEKLDKVGSVIDRGNDKLVTFVNDLARKTSDKLDAAAEATENKVAKQILEAGSFMAKLVNEEDSAILMEGVVEAANRLDGFEPLTSLVHEIVGRTDSNAAIYDMIKAGKTSISQGRQQFREELPKLIATKFTRTVEDAEWSAMFHGMGKTDLASLHGSFSMVRIMRLLEKPGEVAKEIKALQAHLSAHPHWDLIDQKSRELAFFMNGGVASPNLLRNAKAIAHLFGELPPKVRKAMAQPTEKDIKAIDRLVSLYALEALDEATKDSLSSLAQNETEGLQFVMSYLVGQRKDEQRKVFPGSMAEFNHYKGHVTTENDGGSVLIVAEDAEFPKLSQLGFVKIADYAGSRLEHGPSKSYYFASVSSRAPYLQGIAQNVRTVASGVDPHTGYTVGGTAGVIEDPRLIELMTKHLRVNTGREALLPVYDETGKIVAFERSMDPIHNQKLDINTNMAEVLGVWRGRQVEELRASKFNNRLIANLAEMWDKERTTKKDQYVNLFASSSLKDPVLKDAVKLFTPEMRALIAGHFNPGEFWVRSDLVNNVTGYRNPSVGDAWTGISRWSPEVQQQARAVATAIFGKDAFTKVMKAERLYQTFISDAKVTIVVKSVVVPIANIMSNMVHLVGRGVPMVHIAKAFPKKAAEVDAFIKGRIERIRLEGELRAAEGRNDIVGAKKLKAQIQSILDANRRMSIWPLLEANEFASISDAGVSHEEIQLTEGRLSAYMEKLTSKLPPEMRTLARYGIVARETALFKGLQRAVEYGDFLAKATLYDDLVLRQGKDPVYALGRVTEEFVNYDYLPGRTRTGLENMGVTWFWHFKLRALKIAVSTIRHNPLNLLLASLIPLPDMFGSIGTPVSDNVVSIGLEGNLGWSVGPEQMIHAHTLNPWVNLWA